MAVRSRRIPLWVLIALLIAGSTSAQTFVNVTASSGLNHPAWTGYSGFGRGACVADFDGDGIADVLCTGGAGVPIQWFPGDGQGGFGNPVVVWNLGVRNDKQVIAADIDRDGDQDVYVCQGSFAPNLLFINDGTGSFTEEAVLRGVAGGEDSYAATFGDIDRDGDLDLYVGNQFGIGPGAYGVDRLYENDGSGFFTDVTAAAGLPAPGVTLAALFFDYDGDGWPDLWIGHDRAQGLSTGPPNFVFRNDGDGTFTDVSTAINGQAEIDCMGITIGDIANDGGFDVFVTNVHQGGHVLHVWDPTNAVYELPGGDYYANAVAWGVAGTQTGWGCNFFDYDHDAWLDLFVMSTGGFAGVPPTNELFHGGGAAGFTNVTASSQITLQSPLGYSSLTADVDSDGDLDLILAGGNTAAQVLRNDGSGGHWLMLDLRGTTSNPDAIGALVLARHGATVQRRMVTSGEGYLSDGDRRVHFGLGSTTIVDEIEIRWPSGTVQYLQGVAADQVVLVTEPEIVASGSLTPGAAPTLGVGLPGDAGLPGAFAFSLQTDPPIPLPDGRVIRAFAGDPLLALSLVPGNPILPAPAVLLDGSGAAQTVVTVPPVGALVGLAMHALCVTLDFVHPGGVKSIVGPQRFVIQ